MGGTISEPVEQPVAGPTGRRPFVIVADDSAEMRGVIKDVLVSAGFDVTAVPSGTRALDVMTKRRPDLLITDLLMPGMSGFSLRARMLRNPTLADVPVVVLSAFWHRPSETLDVLEVLPKPINIDRLIETARRITGLDRASVLQAASLTPASRGRRHDVRDLRHGGADDGR